MSNEIEDDYRNEQAHFNSLSSIPRDAEGQVARFFKGMDCPDQYTCDVVYIDRLTGKEIYRYDGADPANTRFDYGATPDSDIFARKGLNIRAMIDPSQAVISLEQCRAMMRVDTFSGYDDYGDEYDDYDPAEDCDDYAEIEEE